MRAGGGRLVVGVPQPPAPIVGDELLEMVAAGADVDVLGTDVGWLSFSADDGAHWSAPLQAPPDRLNVPHIMEVTGGGIRLRELAV